MPAVEFEVRVLTLKNSCGFGRFTGVALFGESGRIAGGGGCVGFLAGGEGATQKWVEEPGEGWVFQLGILPVPRWSRVGTQELRSVSRSWR